MSDEKIEMEKQVEANEEKGIIQTDNSSVEENNKTTKCSKCNKELEDGAQFCDSCGTEVFETFFCSACGKQTSTEFAFCQNCGAPITKKSVVEQPETETIFTKIKKKILKKAIIFGPVGAVVIAALIAITSSFSGGVKTENNFAMYVKDKEIFFSDLKKDSKAWQLTSRLMDTDKLDEQKLAFSDYQLGRYTYMSEDGKYIFFPDKLEDDRFKGLTLYYKEFGDSGAEAIKIDSSVYSYTVNNSSTLVTYLKGEEGNLYQYKIGEDSRDKLAGEVSRFNVSDDGTKICYVDSEGNIYLKTEGKDKEKIASGVSSLEYLNNDLTTVYYIKDGVLYKQVEGEDKVKIASDVHDVIKIYDSGEIYYLKGGPKTVSIMDCITDDMKDADASITKPEKPSYPYRSDYDTYDEYTAAYESYKKAYEAYYDANKAYVEKLDRDSVREKLKKVTLEHSSCTLCYFDGKEEAVITSSYVGGEYNFPVNTTAADAAVIAFKTYNQSNIEKVKFSEILQKEKRFEFSSNYDRIHMVEEALFSSPERYIAVKGVVTAVEQEKNATEIKLSADGTVAYYIDDVPDEKYYGTLYRIPIKNGVVGKAEVYDSDVYLYGCYFLNGSKMKYFKEYNGKGELYIDKEKIDYDVSEGNVVYNSDMDKVFYFVDWNSEKGYGTLKVYQNGESVKIADCVYDYSLANDDRVLYLYDYSLNYHKGELHEWNNGETRKIDDDVVCIIPVSEDKHRGR